MRRPRAPPARWPTGRRRRCRAALDPQSAQSRMIRRGAVMLPQCRSPWEVVHSVTVVSRWWAVLPSTWLIRRVISSCRPATRNVRNPASPVSAACRSAHHSAGRPGSVVSMAPRPATAGSVTTPSPGRATPVRGRGRPRSLTGTRTAGGHRGSPTRLRRPPRTAAGSPTPHGNRPAPRCPGPCGAQRTPPTRRWPPRSGPAARPGGAPPRRPHLLPDPQPFSLAVPEPVNGVGTSTMIVIAERAHGVPIAGTPLTESALAE